MRLIAAALAFSTTALAQPPTPGTLSIGAHQSPGLASGTRC